MAEGYNFDKLRPIPVGIKSFGSTALGQLRLPCDCATGTPEGSSSGGALMRSPEEELSGGALKRSHLVRRILFSTS